MPSFHLRFSDHEGELIALAARGFRSRPACLVAIIRAAIANATPLTDRECALLAESSRELAAIGRNLNQLVRHFNAQEAAGVPVQVGRITPEVLEDLYARNMRQIDENTALVNAATRRGWQMKPIPPKKPRS